MLTGSVCLGVSFTLLALITSRWQLYVLYFFIGIGICTNGPLIATTVIPRWFEARRGLAVGICFAGTGLGGMVMVPVAEFFVSQFRWRGAYLLLGIIVLLIAPLILSILLKEKPEDLGLLPDGKALNHGSSKIDKEWGNGQRERAFSSRESLKTYSFWLLALAGFLFAGTFLSLLPHFVPILTDAKVTPKFAAAMLGLTVGMSIIGRIGAGILSDKFNKRYVLIACLLLQGGAIVFLMKPENFGSIPIFAIMFGVAYGGATSSTPLVLGEFFGIKSLGEIYGYYLLLCMIGAFLGPLIAGAIYDVYGDYSLALIIFLFSCLVAGGLVSLAKRPNLTLQHGQMTDNRGRSEVG